MAGKLTDMGVKRASPGKHGDGAGLWLVVGATGTKKWVFRFMRAGRAREMGLGSYPVVGLAAARTKALDARRALADGLDPIEAKKPPAATQTIPTFGQMADEYFAAHKDGWRSEIHAAQWRASVATYCGAIRDLRVDEIGVEEVLTVLKPVWTRAPETASRLRGRIEVVLDAAKAKRYRAGDNPAAWRGNLDHLLHRQSKIDRGHFAALDYKAIADFIASLRGVDTVAARCLEFVVLTACRSSEVMGATWAEIDEGTKIWTIPAARMKGGREQRVPLSDRALAILAEMRRSGASNSVFPGRGRGSRLSVTALTRLLQRVGVNSTVHGFRSTFRDWAGNETHFPREIAEQALAHAIGDAAEQAYRRGDALEKRRALMAAWAAFCEPAAAAGNVHQFRAKGA